MISINFLEAKCSASIVLNFYAPLLFASKKIMVRESYIPEEEASGNVNEQWNEQDIASVQDGFKKAQKVAKQIQQQTKKNKSQAKLLAILLQYTEWSGVLSYVSALMLIDGISIEDVFYFFLPFLGKYLEEAERASIYPHVLGHEVRSLVDYSHFIKNQLDSHKAFHLVEQQLLVEFFMQIIILYDIAGVWKDQILDKNDPIYQRLFSGLQTDLFW